MPTTINGTTGISATSVAFNQTWQDVSGGRTIGNPYTNNTGQTIKVAVAVNGTTGASASSVSWSVAGIIRGYQTTAMSNGASYIAYTFQLYFEVPAGAAYQVTNSSGTNSIATWMELR